MRTIATWSLVVLIFDQIQAQEDALSKACTKLPNDFNFCGGGNILICCDKNGSYGIRNCNDLLYAIPPVGLKMAAKCWQKEYSTIDGVEPTGDCAVDGTVYPLSGPPFTIPSSFAPKRTSFPSNTASLSSSSPALPAVSSSPALTPTYTTHSNSTLSAPVITSPITPFSGKPNSALPSSDTNYTSWSFIRPSVNPVLGCDIFGPLCQTGLIAVGVNLTTTVTTTTMPCSSYLSAQSTYEAFLIQDNLRDIDYMTSFGRSPQCKSFAQSLSYSTYSRCNNASGTLLDVRSYWPAGVSNRPQKFGPDFLCCGPCQVVVPQVRVLYWPLGLSSNCSVTNDNYISQASSSLTSKMLLKREHSIIDDEAGIAIIDGYTFTSPSLYIEVVGTAKVTDFCGQIGSVYTNVTFPVSALSTISYNVPIGGRIWSDSDDPEGGITKTLNTDELACPTWGVETPNGGLLGYTVGPPFFPIIVPPPELLSFDPLWASCSYVGVANFILSYGIFDPPRILTPEAYLTPPPKTVPASPIMTVASKSKSQDPATPGGSRSPGLPFKTVGSPIPETTLIPIDPSSTPSTDLSAVDRVQAQKTTAQIAGNGISSSNSDPWTKPLQTGDRDPQTTILPVLRIEDNILDNFVPSKTTTNLGVIIYNAFGAGEKTPNIVTADNHAIISINPTVIAVDGKTIVANAGAATMSGEMIFPDSSDSLVIIAQHSRKSIGYFTTAPVPLTIGYSTAAPVPLTIGYSTAAPVPLTIAGQIIPATMSLGALVVGTHTLLPGESAVTISGTPVSLARSDRVVVGTSTLSLSTPFSVTIGQQAYVVTPIGTSDFEVAGYTLIPGGPAATVSGIPISLGQSGMLLIGTSVTAQTMSLQHSLIVDQTHIPSQTDPREPVDAASAPTSAMTSMTNSSAGGLSFYGESATWGPGLLPMALGIGISLAGLWE